MIVEDGLKHLTHLSTKLTEKCRPVKELIMVLYLSHCYRFQLLNEEKISHSHKTASWDRNLSWCSQATVVCGSVDVCFGTGTAIQSFWALWILWYVSVCSVNINTVLSLTGHYSSLSRTSQLTSSNVSLVCLV